MTSMPRVLIIKRKLVPFENKSRYRSIDISHWLREEVQWIIDKNFRENTMI